MSFILLCHAIAGEPEQGSAPRPGAIRPSFVVTQLPIDEKGEEKPSHGSGMLRRPYGDGARIVLVDASSAVRRLTSGFHSAADPCLSFDGQRMLFAAKRTAADRWAIYELTFRSGAFRRIIQMPGDCRSPSYQGLMYTMAENAPWHQITFVATGPDRVNESGDGLSSAIYSCKLDGSFVQRLTYNLSSDFDPAILPDGRFVFAAWRMATFDRGRLAGRIALMGVNTDGIDLAAFAGYVGRRVQHMPCVTGAGLVVFVEADQVPWDGAGMLSCVSLRRPLHTYRPITAAEDGLFHSPSGLPDGRILVSRRPADGSSPHGVYCLDPVTKRREVVFADSRFHCIQSQALVSRPEPDGRSSVLASEDPMGKLYCLDVYKTAFKDPSWFARGTAKTIRVLEGIPRTCGDNGASALQSPVRVPQLAAKRVLAESSLTADGSFNLEVPASVPIQLQLLDERGLALRTCGWIWARNHSPQGCIGCHEDPELTPTNLQVDALSQGTVLLAAARPPRETVDFRRDVMPIVEEKCAGCHAAQGIVPRLDRGRPAKTVYETLLASESPSSGRVRWKYVDPGKARTSPLVWHLLGINTSRPWDGSAARQPVKPIPSDKSPPLSTGDKSTLIRWIDLGATWDSAPVSTVPRGGQK